MLSLRIRVSSASDVKSRKNSFAEKGVNTARSAAHIGQHFQHQVMGEHGPILFLHSFGTNQSQRNWRQLQTNEIDDILQASGFTIYKWYEMWHLKQMMVTTLIIARFYKKSATQKKHQLTSEQRKRNSE
jgi:hypothetical protein